MAYFNFVSDEDLVASVRLVIDAAKKAIDNVDKDFEKNTLDPFAALFAVTFTGVSLEQWNSLESERQVQKSIQNSIGAFHQTLLGSFQGWVDPGKGGSIDLYNEDRKIIAEVKNKHNTLNSGGQSDTYKKLADHLKYDRKGYTAYLVQIVPQRSLNYDVKWSPNLTTTALREDIRRIDGESFYDLASGEPDTLRRIYKILPEIVSKLNGDKVTGSKELDLCLQLFDRVYK